jgi:hypothetical protein
MKNAKRMVLACVFIACGSVLYAGEEVDRLLEEYGRVETVSCQIRRTKEGAPGKMKFLSRVYYTNKDRIHAEGITPVNRRTIADGTRLYQYAEGDPKGFSRPIRELSEQMTISLRMVPGSPMDHLLRLKGLAEEPLPAAGGAARRVGLQAEKNYVVLSLDDKDRLVGIEFFATPEMSHKMADYRYADLTEVLPGVWIPFRHEVTMDAAPNGYRETVHVDRYVANEPVAASLFVASSFFDKDIDFVDDFEKIYPE